MTTQTEVATDLAEAIEAAFEEYVTRATGIRVDSGGEREIAMSDEWLLPLVGAANSGDGELREVLAQEPALTPGKRP